MTLATSGVRRPRQTDLRRSLSAAYYGVFHFCLKALADQLIGAARYGAADYTAAYRSVAHKTLRDLCDELRKPTLSPKFRPYYPGGVDLGLRRFCEQEIELQKRRHAADYDIAAAFTRTDAMTAIADARGAIGNLTAAPHDQQRMFLTLLAFPPNR